MNQTLYFSINLTIEVAKTKDINSLENLFCSFTNFLEGDELGKLFEEVATYLSKHQPIIFKWFTTEVKSYLEYIDIVNDEGNTNNPEDKLEEFDSWFLDTVFYLYKEDIVHILLDEGMTKGKHFKDKGEKIWLSKKARNFLEECYEIDSIETLIDNY